MMTKSQVQHFYKDILQDCVQGGVLGESIERAQQGEVVEEE